MKRVLLFLIGGVTPAADREWVVGDTEEEFGHIEQAAGAASARKWLRRELGRVLLQAPRHWLARRHVRQSFEHAQGDGVMTTIWQDLRYALRLLGRSPGFAATAIVTLALGIGANSAMFAVVNGVLLKPLPFHDPDRLMLVHLTSPDRDHPAQPQYVVWSYPKDQMFSRTQEMFSDAALFFSRDLNLSGQDGPERVRGEVVTERYPAVLGVEPVLGRTFRHEESDQEGAIPVAMIGHGVWTRRFGADREILGRTVQINDTAHIIVGVLPPGFRGLNGDAEVWVPLGTVDAWALKEAQGHSYYLVARRKSDVSEQAAITAVRALGGQIDALHQRGSRESWGATAASLYESRVDGDLRRAAIVLLGAVGFVLLIACANLASVVAAKTQARRREVAVRVALGAGRSRIVRQFLAEGAVLASLGAAAGIGLTWMLLTAAGSLLPESDVFFRTAMAPGAPRTPGAAGLTRIGAAMIGLDGATLLFTAGVSILTALLVSLMPALHAASLRPVDALKDGGRSGSERGFRVLGTRAVLVSSQIALALVLLAGAGLMIKSAARLYATSIGVRTDHVLTGRLDLPGPRYSYETGAAFFGPLVERLRAIAGVESAGLANCAVVSGGCNATSLTFMDAPTPSAIKPSIGVHWATPGFFSTVGISVLQGRNFLDTDRAGQPKVVLVNEAAARTFWPNDTPIGKRIALGQGRFHDGAEVIGIVSDVRYRAIESAATPDVYIPLAQSFQPRMRLFVRSRLDARSLVPLITREVRALDPNLPLSEIKWMDERVGDAMWRTRVTAWLLSAFAGLALLLTAIGVFGVMAQTVSQCTEEIGIRMALGAQRRDVLALVLTRAAIITSVGLVLGIGSAFAATRLISTLLYDVEADDPTTFVAVAGLLGVVALAACYFPARRATRVDAVVALRAD